MAKLRCVECSAIFTDSEVASDALLCPTCGARLESDICNEETGSRKKAKSEGSPNHNWHANHKIHTHYDNLKVARNAPDEVIRAAYRTLSQKYHPDLNQSNPDATKIMMIINAAFEVLSNPEKRRAHDQWIAQQEMPSHENRANQSQTHYASATGNPKVASRAGSANLFRHLGKSWFWYVLAGFIFWGFANSTTNPPPPGPKPYQATPPTPAKEAYLRPLTAPNGQPWPASSAYVLGYQRLHTNGRSKVTVDNSQNDSDVFVKLVSIDTDKAYPVRTFYIPGRESFTLNKVSAGSYDIRYRDLETGQLSRSEAFQLEEVRTGEGIQFSNLRMTLYKVRNGNMETYSLAEGEF